MLASAHRHSPADNHSPPPPTGRHHVIAGGGVEPSRLCRLHAAGCSATTLGLRLLLSIKFIITFYYFQTLLLLEYITHFIHIYI